VGQAHRPVLATAATAALVVDPAGRYVDATFGRGGHSELILQRLSDAGRLMAVDRDAHAIAAGRARFHSERRICFRHSAFSRLRELVAAAGWRARVSGLLLDLGVSSPQLEQPERGFSFQATGPLDMRMDASGGQTAGDWLQSAAPDELVRVLREYGEERFARRIARAIVRARDERRIATTTELAQIVAGAVPVRGSRRHPATRTFQAIRMQINRELDELAAVLAAALELLVLGGRLVVISFHSLEDRTVKRFMRTHSRPRPVPREIPLAHTEQSRPPLRLVGRAQRPLRAEILANPRARSATMRVAEKMAEGVAG